MKNCGLCGADLPPKHPLRNQRLWQSIRNLSGENFVLTSTHFDSDMFNKKWISKNKVEIKDTFYDKISTA